MQNQPAKLGAKVAGYKWKEFRELAAGGGFAGKRDA
jgi:hypothetical protein